MIWQIDMTNRNDNDNKQGWSLIPKKFWYPQIACGTILWCLACM